MIKSEFKNVILKCIVIILNVGIQYFEIIYEYKTWLLNILLS